MGESEKKVAVRYGALLEKNGDDTPPKNAPVLRPGCWVALLLAACVILAFFILSYGLIN